MKRKLFITAVVVAFILSSGMVLAQQQGYGQGYGPQGQGYGQGGPQGQGWFCPWCGQQYGRGMGPGMMYRGQGMRQGRQGRGMPPGMMQGWQGQGMGPGMMQRWHGQGMRHGGRGMGRGMMGDQWDRRQYGPSGQYGQYGPSYGQQQREPLNLNKSEAQELAEDYVAGNPNLTIGEITEKDEIYEAMVETKDGSLVEKLLIDKQTGWMKRAY